VRKYFYVKREASAETVINRSRFIAAVTKAEDAAAAAEFLKAQKHRYPMATHYCYAYVVGGIAAEARFSDDGEPQGTAGLPMLEILKKRALTDTAAVVTRYFGGIKLGTGGLNAAYSKSLLAALDSAEIGEMIYSRIYRIKCLYGDFQPINTVLGKHAKILNAEYGEDVKLDAALPEDKTDSILAMMQDAVGGRLTAIMIEEKFVDYTD
jgi:uncharacterized YigZ family protein